ncbi:MAG: metallophosphoesterase family protein [Actinomycetota bacterium]|nr:metallophosphoesterase family protein [Actinomycetota bacterium]
MLLVSDIHGASDALARVAASTEILVVLGDLVNLIDYRTSEGIVADVIGADTVGEISRLRAERRHEEANGVWRSAVRDREVEVHDAIGELMSAEYVEVCAALEGTSSYVIYGNADRPPMLAAHLPPTAELLDAETREIEGHIVGFVGGGIPRIGTSGEVSGSEMREKLNKIGAVDILCTHVPPDVLPLASDVIGRTRKGSPEILEYLLEYEPQFHYFGDIHQPKATTWRVGNTTCINVGYFRATGRAVRHG